MTHLHLTSLRRATVLAAITGVAALAPAATVGATAKSKASKRTGNADLIVRDLEVEFAGETLAVYADVTNVGTKRTNHRTDTFVALSGDETLDRGDNVLDETSVRRLRAGRTYELETEVDIPADEDLPAGDVYLLVCADGDNAVRETSEQNNCSAELIASEDDAVSEDEEASADESSDDGQSDEDFPVVEDR